MKPTTPVKLRELADAYEKTVPSVRVYSEMGNALRSAAAQIEDLEGMKWFYYRCGFTEGIRHSNEFIAQQKPLIPCNKDLVDASEAAARAAGSPVNMHLPQQALDAMKAKT